MADIFKAPQKYDKSKYKEIVFLAGSIEMGKAIDWQIKVTGFLKDIDDLCILNPRRDDWDSIWGQSVDNAQFREQVEWELKGQDDATMIVMYFDPDTKSPITLLELGLFAQSNKLIVYCPEGFWRKGNVDVVCKWYGIPQVESWDQLVDSINDAKD